MNREEAIKIIKSATVYTPEEMQALELLIPELRESDDERIRKWLVGLIEAFAWRKDWTCSKAQVLAWLEKQKEQKPAEQKLYVDKDSPMYPKNFTDLPGNEQPAEWSDGYREDELRTRIAFYTYKDEEGVLYLSNFFVEETSRNQGFGTKILKAAEKFAEAIGAVSIRLKVEQDSPANAWYRKNGYGYMTFEDGYDWLEKTLEYLKPKQEWSEEDEMIFKHCLVILHDYGYDEWLKSLRSQPKQEWDEEDEKMFKSLKTLLNDASCYSCTEGVDRILSWLEFLRPQPHWKPSEEQMEALKNSAYGTYQNGDGPALRELYEQLKAL